MSSSDPWNIENLRAPMEVPRPRNFRNPNYQTWLWDPLNAILQEETGRNIRIGDVDGCAHLREGDRILLLEGTANRDKPDRGQVEALRSLARRSGITVVYFEGDYPHPPSWTHRVIRDWSQGDLSIDGFITADLV